MAASCPNCGRKLTIFDWKQTCPECGINLMYHGFEERFYEDAKKAELGLARTRVWWAKVMSCLLGGVLQKLRLFLVLLPVLAALIPVCSLQTALPLYSAETKISLIGLISAFSDGTMNLVMSLRGGEIIGSTMNALFLVGASFAVCVLLAALLIVCEIICFAGPKVMSVILCVLSGFGIVSSAVTAYAAFALGKAVSGYSSLFSFKSGFGAFALIFAFAVYFAVCTVICVKGIKIKYKDGDLYRMQVAKKIKKGEMTFDELPWPIFETAEEHAERMQAIADTVSGREHCDEEEVKLVSEEVEKQ